MINNIKAQNTELLYLKIASEIKRCIANGELAPGDTVTSERKLAHNYGVSYDTIRKAIQSLAACRPEIFHFERPIGIPTAV